MDVVGQANRCNCYLTSDLRRGVRLTSFGPKATPLDVALRCGKDNNVPQIQFNEDGVWHNWTLDGPALKEGPWLPYLRFDDGVLSPTDLRIDGGRATESFARVSHVYCGALFAVRGQRVCRFVRVPARKTRVATGFTP
jgi:hypothetical protein